MIYWFSIPGYEGYYELGLENGQPVVVKSLERKGCKKERLLKTIVDKNGYLHVSLYKDSIHKTWQFHQLMLHIHGIEVPKGMEIAHNNGNPKNNSIFNLRVATRKENQADKKIHGTEPNLQGERHGKSILTEEIVKEAQALYNNPNRKYGDIKKYAKEIGVNYKTLRDAATGRNWNYLISAFHHSRALEIDKSATPENGRSTIPRSRYHQRLQLAKNCVI